MPRPIPAATGPTAVAGKEGLFPWSQAEGSRLSATIPSTIRVLKTGTISPERLAELTAAGIAVSSALCEHFELSRAELFEAVRVTELVSFTEIVGRFGSGRGCDICKPVVASVLASQHQGYILDDGRGTLQDTNDRAMANMQKDGTYSVVPRIPGGEITPEGLIVIGQVAADFGLYTKITGGQRIDLFGARLDQLPDIWTRLVDAGFESGQAYGKALRTVKSCVGSTWCRYGVQDSVGMAIELELRYRGLRSPTSWVRGVRLRPGMRRGPQQGRRCHRHRERLEHLRRRQRRVHPAARAIAGDRRRRRDIVGRHRPLSHVLRPDGGPAATHRTLDRRPGRWPRPPARGDSERQSRHRGGSRGSDGPSGGKLSGRVGGDPGRPGPVAPVPLVRQRSRHRGPERGAGPGARSTPAGDTCGAGVGRGVGCRAVVGCASIVKPPTAPYVHTPTAPFGAPGLHECRAEIATPGESSQ